MRSEFLYKLNVQADELAFPSNEINGINEANKEGIFFIFRFCTLFCDKTISIKIERTLDKFSFSSNEINGQNELNEQ